MAETPDLKRIGRYDVERVLGEGAMGDAVLAALG